MPDYLTQRNGFWQFVRRVPLDYAEFDTRGIIKQSTKVEVAKDKRGVKASRVAETINRELLAYWEGLRQGRTQEAEERYAAARRRARTLGFDYVETKELSKRSIVEILERFEKMMETGKPKDVDLKTALFGTEKRPTVKLSEVFKRWEVQTRNEVKDMSPNQLKRWKNGYMLAVNDLISVIGDKSLVEISHADVLDYIEWLEDRVSDGEIVAKTANKYVGHNSKMIRSINMRLRLGIPDLFSGMRLQGEKDVARPPFPVEFVQNKLLAEGALAGLNDQARGAVLVIADTGLRLSEAVNLNEETIHLDCEIPYVRVIPDERRVKTDASIREIPLVGTALAAMKIHPSGFPRYRDKGASFSAYVNGFLKEKGLRPTNKHTVYSLRHTFKDRLIESEAQDSMIEALMGHADDHPKYGKGPSLKLKQQWLQKIAFTPPASL